ncbi:hypothetical protein SARC_01264 [Sphaeroforma arctica JP610]|uniref:Uncharacterized protein n=1 Tax=Sphaeroforma arctica JP610 TaxID=667725 RepID=A0A0L0GEC7_9EUKA|nr:hypothetical protein SARC_01264 [Sphaeroforma arctica JP610]KNC86583.1 hypothetical protein SARC_01264 [Sphaeroforma arctica JP610]|eukprot:XP_014160485.1 hypothetical protein SARC_01264 [Sphaeroforma arctica JP610]
MEDDPSPQYPSFETTTLKPQHFSTDTRRVRSFWHEYNAKIIQRALDEKAALNDDAYPDLSLIEVWLRDTQARPQSVTPEGGPFVFAPPLGWQLRTARDVVQLDGSLIQHGDGFIFSALGRWRPKQSTIPKYIYRHHGRYLPIFGMFVGQARLGQLPPHAPQVNPSCIQPPASALPIWEAIVRDIQRDADKQGMFYNQALMPLTSS